MQFGELTIGDKFEYASDGQQVQCFTKTGKAEAYVKIDHGQKMYLGLGVDRR